jgi:queuine/archaeosine tRNA-ribosyltransferase
MASSVELWIGDHPHNFLPDGEFLSAHSKVLDSIANYYDEPSPTIPYQYNNLFLDNGAFGATQRGRVLDPERVKDLQEHFDPDKTIPLDYPFLPDMPQRQMIRRWEKTKENMIDFYETTNLREVIPSLHAWSRESLERNLKWVEKHTDANCIALGSIVTAQFGTGRPYFGDRYPSKQLIDMIIDSVVLIRKLTGFSIHMMGFGSSPLTLHLGFFCGINSTDTTGYRRGAAYGKIIIQGTGWRSVGKKKKSFDVPSPSKSEYEKLSKCRCPACRKDQRLLHSNWKARAVHNKHVLQLEENRARRLLAQGFDAYEEYVAQVFSGCHAPWFVNVWEYARNRVKSMPVLLQSR